MSLQDFAERQIAYYLEEPEYFCKMIVCNEFNIVYEITNEITKFYIIFLKKDELQSVVVSENRYNEIKDKIIIKIP